MKGRKHSIRTIYILLILLTQAFSVSTVAQSSAEKSNTIDWKPYQYTENLRFRSTFEGAHYPAFFNALPTVHRRITGSSVTVRVVDPVFNPAEKDEISDISLIGPELLVRTELVKGKDMHATDVFLLPYRTNPVSGKLERLISFKLEVLRENTPPNQARTAGRALTTQSVLANGNWYKMAVTADGVYRIDRDYLAQNGVLSSVEQVQCSSIRLYGNGGGMLPLLNSVPRTDDLTECGIEVIDIDNDGLFNGADYALFYGQGPHRWTYKPGEKQYTHQKNWFSDTTFYFLTFSDAGIPKRIGNQASLPSSPSDITITSFIDYAFHEEDLKNFIKSGRGWFGESFDVNLTRSFSFDFPNLIPGSARLRSGVAARTSTSFSSSSRFVITNNTTTILTHNVPNVGTSYTDDFARTSALSGTFQATTSPLTLTYTFQPYNASATGWLDYIALNATRQLSFSGDELRFRDQDSTGNGNLIKRSYRINNAEAGLKLWSLKNHNEVRAQQFVLNGNQLEFTQEVDSASSVDYILFRDRAARKPIFSGRIPNQNLHSLAPAKYIIVTPEDFLPEAERLADFRRQNDGLTAHVVTTEAIYNEFSGGAQDIVAIRDFLRMLNGRDTSGSEGPDYVLLFGDGSYDPKSRISGNTNYIPTFQSENSVSYLISYTSDDFFAMLDPFEGTLAGAEIPDVGIGRMPVRNLEQARQMVDKVILYSTPGTVTDNTYCAGNNSLRLGDWRNTLCFIADDQDRNLHLRQSERILKVVQDSAPVYNIDKIASDAYTQISTPGGQRYPDVNDAINKRMAKGALLINYTGHGGELGWASESILNNDMINAWSNGNAMPAFVTATCEFSRYDDPQRTSAGELVLLNPDGGGICLFTTVRLAFAIENELINSNMMKRMFAPIAGEMPRAGDIIRLSKSDNPTNRNVTLLGDPALRLAYPRYRVNTNRITEEISGQPVDTISAFNKISIEGVVKDAAGNTLNNFNGVVYPTIYDKAGKVYTLVNDRTGNDISLPDSFLLRNNVLYKGKVSVKNGRFNCTFIVPKDISIQYGTGRISYYAHNGTDDAHGYNESLIIGGVSSNTLQDPSGPEIRLYMNDENFVSGSITDESPSLFAVLFDSSGINTVGNGIGHDLIAQLDGKPNQLYVLNDFYESDLDSYQQGRVRFPFDKLTEGPHYLTLKAWDINNNSSESRIDFIVASSAKLALERVLNYPNPFTTRTQFLFEHNKPCTGMAIQVQIFTVSGKLVKTLDAYQVCEGFRNTPLEWDGRDEFGDVLAKGVYVYRLRIRTAEGETAQKTEKLVLLR